MSGHDPTGRPMLRAVLVGCGGMGQGQARLLAQHAGYDFVAACDRDPEQLGKVVAAHGVNGYDDFAAMLREQKPEVVAITTPNSSHAPLTIMAAEAGVRGVYCEKPMATNLGDARRMVAVCAERGVKLVINHQRRIGPDLLKAKELIDAGAIGDVVLLRGSAAGDVLSDGTHVVDALQWLTGDQSPKWVLGQVYRNVPEPGDLAEGEPAPAGTGDEGRQRGVAPGYRYGHVVETGAMGVWELPDGVRVELFGGEMREPGRVYQDYEVIGTHGRLWRKDDRFVPDNLFITDPEGELVVAKRQGHLLPGPAEPGDDGTAARPGGWRQVDLSATERRDLKIDGYDRFADMIHDGADHPMSGERALRGFEIVMAIYESARLRQRITLPLEQERFPLELMLEAPQGV